MTKYSNQMRTSHESKAALKLSLDDFLDLERSFLFPKNRASWFSALIIRLPLSREPIASSVLEPRSPWRVNRFVARSIPIEMPLVSEQSERWKTTSRRFFPSRTTETRHAFESRFFPPLLPYDRVIFERNLFRSSRIFWISWSLYPFLPLSLKLSTRILNTNYTSGIEKCIFLY